MIKKIPQIPSSSIAEVSYTDTDTSLDFTLGTDVKTTINANAVLTVAGLNAGERKTLLIKNTHATTTYGVTMPTTYGGVATIRDGGLSSAFIPAGMYVRFYLYHNGAELEISWDGVSSNA